MRIESVKPEPYEKSALPGIIFEVEISHVKHQEAIIGVSGWLETDDGKVVSSINELCEEPKVNELGAKDSTFDSEFREEIYRTRIITLLSERALDYIEKRRMADKKGDVKLNLCLNVKYIQSRAVITHSFPINPKDIDLPEIPVPTSRGKMPGEIAVYAYDPQFSARSRNLWIISGDGGHVFLEVREQLLKKDIKIPCTDWIHDYASKLELGEYFIVEIPRGKKVIEEAWDYVEKAEGCFRTWDIKGVVANCREAGKLLNKKMEEVFGRDSFTYNERWGRAYLRFFDYLVSLGLHLEDMEGKNWEELIKGFPEGFPHPKRRANYPADEIKRFGKADAEHILITTKALVKYAEELLKEVSH